MKAFAAAITLGVVAAQNPAQPTWPQEFKANISDTDLRRNTTQNYYQLYSFSNNAVVNDFTDVTRRGSDSVVDFNDYKVGRHYFTVTPQNGTAFCHASPLNGNIFVPPVGTFVYNGTEPAGGPGNWSVPTYRWVGQAQRPGDLIYHTTANTAETPVGFFDFNSGIRTAFNTIAIVTPSSWPAGTFTPPTNCN